ncbi:hypothetical protein [Rhodococcus pyridinivorans]|uniref:HNH endonuclease n=1 Tax=Rhodococcus pyridinivorans TaxID=103816 RepID=UPI003AAB1C07
MLEAFGFLVLCASLSAAHTTDYHVSWGTAVLVAREEASRMLDVCMRAGLMEEIVVDGTQMWKIVEDPEFLHMRTAEEITWERQRKSDNSNPELIVPVRLRDGDACRYCGQVVKWTARKGRLAGTYDHRVPGRAATIDTMVVSCGRCNSARKDNPAADEQHPLLPAPARPYFSPETRKWIAEHDWAKANGYSITSRRGKTLPPGTVPDDRRTIVERTQRSGSQPDNAPARPDTQSDNAHTASQRSGSRPENATQRPETHSDNANPQRPTNQADNADTKHPALSAQSPDLLSSADPAEHQPPTSGKAGTGRDGSGRVGNQIPSPDRNAPSQPNRTPRRRGRRSKKR